jgi:hypothetical protein
MTSIDLLSSFASAKTLTLAERSVVYEGVGQGFKKNSFLVRATAHRNTERFSLERDGRHLGETL